MSFLFLDLVGPRGLGLGLWANVGIGNSLSNKLYLKVADLAALDGNYYKSIENYEKVAKGAVNSNLMKWSVKDYFLKGGICHLASGVPLPLS